jgi:hypothetical protein
VKGECNYFARICSPGDYHPPIVFHLEDKYRN